ncbi:MAG: sugar ABC transporter ATP-binding protein, partial [Verrucomicrobia bacterium]|nr:sugar ABC transporter ATP-binding protein [Verrucomicrobiota bacterium]
SLNPEILILDEPTSSLGAPDTELLFENIHRLKQQGVSFIYVSHHLPEVFRISDRVTVLRDGKTAGTFDSREITEDFLVRRMVGRELRNMYGERGPVGRQGLFQLRKPARRGTVPVVLEIAWGEIVGLAGLIGAGRTELAQEIAGITPNPLMEMHLNGKRFMPRSPRDAIRQGVTYLTENRKELGLYLAMSIKDNVVAPSLPKFANRLDFMQDRKVDVAAAQAKERFNIATPTVRRRVGQLSGGNQQKVLLSMWIGAGPKLLIVDEPTRGVDVGAKAEIYRHLRTLAANGVGIVLISSELQEILGISDRILVMRDHRIVAEFSGPAASEEDVILAATGVTERKGV